MARGADTTAPQNAPGEQRAPGEQQAAAGRCEREQIEQRAERVEATARHAREVVERVLWDHDNRWEAPQRFGLDHHQPIHPEESYEQGGRRGVQAGSVADEEGGPQRVVQMEDEMWGLQEWAWRSPREAKVDSGGWLGGVEAGPSEAWASGPADLPRRWLGETEDAPEELPQSEPADLTRHRLGETEDAPRSCRTPPRSREGRPVDLEPRLGTQRLGQASQLT
jgi:hypothetical protein